MFPYPGRETGFNPVLKRRPLRPEIFAGGPAEAPAGAFRWEISNLRQ